MEIASKVFALGNSNAIRLPHLVMEALSLKAEDPIVIEVINNNELLIKKQAGKNAYPSIEELFSGHAGNYQPVEMESSGIVGREVI